MGRVPDGLSIEHHRDLAGRERRPVLRQSLLALLGLVLVVALLNVFGQRPVESTAAATGATLEVSAPKALRGGLYFQARFRIAATAALQAPTLVLDRGWIEGITINTMTPAPVEEVTVGERLGYRLPALPAGQVHYLYFQLQVNPTTVGRRAQDVELYDGEQLVVGIDRTITIWP